MADAVIQEENSEDKSKEENNKENDGNSTDSVQHTDTDNTRNEVMEKPGEGENLNENSNNKNETDSKGKKMESDKENSAPAVNKDESSKKKVTVDLKSLKPNYNPHMKTTLPDILTEYGLEDSNKQPVKERSKKKKKRKSNQEENEDEEVNKRKSKDEKFRQAFGDNRQSDTYYMEYLEFLEKKVQEERLKAQKMKEEEAKKALVQAEDEQSPIAEPVEPPVVEEKQKRYNIRRLERVELKHDDTFIKGLHKTDLARIIALQDKLVLQGKLKTQGDKDLFWQDIKKPDVFYSHFKVKMHTESSNSSAGKLSEPQPGMAPTQIQPDMGHRMLSNISETSRGDKEPWAITQKFASTHGDRSPTPERHRKNSSQIAKEAATDLEWRCPKLEMPALSCFNLKLGEKPPDPEEVQRKIELKLREKNRKKFQRKLGKMYQMAMTHSAAATRILSNHGDLMSVVEGATLRDVLSVFDEPEPYTIDDYYRDVTDPSRAIEVHPEMHHGYDISPAPSRHTSAGSSGSRTKTPPSRTAATPPQRQKITLEKIEAPPPLPLSYNEMIIREKTMEPKCLSSNWTNYMHAGKSVFSTS